MALLHRRLSSASSDFSEELSSHESIPHDTMAPPASPPGSLAEEGKAYSDQDIEILYGIVTRAEEILSELTPSSRLPTHALFKAYDEVLLQHGIDPDDDQRISKLVFMVGGVKGTDSVMEKFKKLMARMDITVQYDNLPIHGSDRGDIYTNPASIPDDLSIASDAAYHRFVVHKDAHKLPSAINGGYVNFNVDNTGDGYAISNGRYNYRLDDVNGNISDEDNFENMSKIEQHLESSAIAFREKHHNKFSAASTLRQWQTKSNFISNLCDQFDAARQADLEEDVEAKFEEWRAIAAEVNEMPPQSLPPNVYSKRIEEIAIRAHEIHAMKTSLRRWRHNAREQRRKIREIEESSDPLERVAAKAHKNLMLSRAFSNWSNRLEEESKRAQMAAKFYEMSLKSKAFGIRQHPSDNIDTGGIAGTHFSTSPAADVTRPGDVSELVSSRGIVGSDIPVGLAGPSSIAIDVNEKAPLEAFGNYSSSHDESSDSTDEMDEMTMLARRHILRMRYYDVWERYTADNLNKVKDFEAEQQVESIAHAIPIWRSQAEQASQERETLRYNAERANHYNKAIKVLDVWRRESQEKMQGQGHMLEQYAARANFYHKATKSLPVWRNETEQATRQQEVLELYANRAEYYHKGTKALPIWRERAQQVAEHEEQTLTRYAERADYYYKTRDTLLAWNDLAKQKRKRRLREAHLETRRIVKKGMGQRCIAEWREKLQPSFERYETMNSILEDVTADREWRQSVEILDTWRERAQERDEMGLMSDAMVKGKLLEQWKDRSANQQELYIEAEGHWKEKATSRVLKDWNLRSLQMPNRPLMVANALEKKDRRLLRTGFESWYSRTADKLVPVELPDGSYKSVEQVVEDAQHQASLNQAKGLLGRWQAAAKTKTKTKTSESVQEEAYAPTPGRPRLFLGGLGRRETTTPLAPVPSRTNWRASETALRGSLVGGRANRSGRPGRNLRVSWAQ
ncbi:hypothetical protein F4677DRAFT_117195 [Hypoxylon crocopeplum]|nr:hypothetical protein F4677DRAFT_117195 [Hypoxylon crocopeplum]